MKKILTIIFGVLLTPFTLLYTIIELIINYEKENIK
jgi:hypothetical protein